VIRGTRPARLSEERVARLEPPGTGERTVWCASLPRFGVRMRAAGAAKTFVVKYRGADGRQRKMTLGNWPALSVDDARRLARLVDALNGHPNRRAANAVRLLLLTGARRGEVLAATWEQFDLAAGVWTKPSAHTKQKRAHRVPLSAPALALLLTMRAEAEAAGHGSPHLFPGDAPGKPLGDIKNFWGSVCRRAGVAGVRLHDLRHQYASMLASAGLSLPIIGRLLGHTQAQTTARYAHLFDDPLRQATERVGALIEGAGGAGGATGGPAPRRPAGG